MRLAGLKTNQIHRVTLVLLISSGLGIILLLWSVKNTVLHLPARRISAVVFQLAAIHDTESQRLLGIAVSLSVLIVIIRAHPPRTLISLGPRLLHGLQRSL